MSPVRPPEPFELRLNDTLKAGAATSPYVLLAEPDRIHQTVVARLFGLMGHAVDVVPSGQTALERWRSAHVDLLLVSPGLSDMQGRTLVDRVRTHEAALSRARTPIVAVGASAARLGDLDGALDWPLHGKTLQAALSACLHPTSLLLRPGPSRPGPAVDFAVLHRMVGGDESVQREFLQCYLSSAQEQARHLRRAYQRGDVRLAAALVHKLRVASMSVGAVELGELCAEMEAPPLSDFGGVELTHERFNRTFEAAVACIEQHLEEGRT
jgi:CheY-like chemotaxis protein